MTNKIATVVVAIFAMLVVFLGGIAIFFLVIKPYEPKIKYAEFPFSLTYKLEGQTITISDTYVCEFDGVRWDTSHGFYRKWKGYVKGTGLENVLITEDSQRQIFCRVGHPQYYMGDDKYLYWAEESLSPPHLYPADKINNFDFISVEQIKQNYQIEIISWEFSEPIKNSFKKGT